MILLLATAAVAQPPPFVVLGSKVVRQTTTGYQVTKPDGSRVEWRKGASGRWTDGKQIYSPTQHGWSLQGKGEVFTRMPGYWSHAGATVFTNRNGLRLGSTEYRYTPDGGAILVP